MIQIFVPEMNSEKKNENQRNGNHTNSLISDKAGLRKITTQIAKRLLFLQQKVLCWYDVPSEDFQTQNILCPDSDRTMIVRKEGNNVII